MDWSGETGEWWLGGQLGRQHLRQGRPWGGRAPQRIWSEPVPSKTWCRADTTMPAAQRQWDQPSGAQPGRGRATGRAPLSTCPIPTWHTPPMPECTVSPAQCSWAGEVLGAGGSGGPESSGSRDQPLIIQRMLTSLCFPIGQLAPWLSLLGQMPSGPPVYPSAYRPSVGHWGPLGLPPRGCAQP